MSLTSSPTAFAVLDILGYGNLMCRKPEEVVVVVEELMAISERNWIIQRDIDRFAHFSNGVTAPKIEYLQFSDSLLIWLPAHSSAPPLFKEPSQLIESVSYAAALTLAIFISSGVPLRGAVGFGDTYISREPLFFTGKELYKTMKLERQQKWAGAAIHSSAERFIKNIGHVPFFLNYPIPMPQYSSCCPPLAIDWVTPLSVDNQLTPPWEQMFQGNDDEVLIKGRNTRQFFEKTSSMERHFPIYLSESTVKSIRKRTECLRKS